MDAPLLLQLKTEPLGLLAMLSGKGYWMPLTPVTAQSLAFALLGQPGVGYEPKPELLAMVTAEAEAHKKADGDFLSSMGVSL